MMSAVSFTIAASDYVRGDCNQDGNVSIADVTSLIDYLLSEDASLINLDAADTNKDGNISISDISSLLDYLLAGSWPDEPTPPDDEGYYVDLGLPSGTLWATMNVGASSPEDFGYFLAWGETEPKDVETYTWSGYKWCEGNVYSFTKYNRGFYGIYDGKSELDPEDDAAYVHYPNGRTPTREQIHELIYYCDAYWTQINGVKGYKLQSIFNHNTIFLPVAGSIEEGVYYGPDNYSTYYWSRNLSERYDELASCMYLSENKDPNWSDSGSRRCDGCLVRPVRMSEN
jgi:hypothetical protein